LRQVPRDDTNPPIVALVYQLLFGAKDPVAEPGTVTGSPGDWWTVFALRPDILQHCVDGFTLYNSPERVIDPVLRELGQTRVGWACGSQFVFSQHCKSIRALGVPDDKIEAIKHWQASDLFSPVERLVLAYTDCLAYDHGRVPDGLFEALRSHLSDEQILDLTYTTSLYLMHAVMSRALRTEFDDRPDPIEEVEGPEGVSAWDLEREAPTGD
jgi:alkylhydroperoxidase family enzyme